MVDIADLLAIPIRGLIAAVFLRAILRWFPIDRSGLIFQALASVTDPVLVPLRRVLPRMGTIDIAPTVAIILLYGLLKVITAAS